MTAFYTWLMMSLAFTPAPGDGYRVVYVVSPTCKICQYYALEMRKLDAEYGPEGFYFEALVPGDFFTEEDVQQFRETWQLPFPVKRDLAGEHAVLGAQVVPEVFVIDPQGVVVYHGRIDDSFARVGKRRSVVRHHELRDALGAIVRGESVPVAYQPAVGCIID